MTGPSEEEQIKVLQEHFKKAYYQGMADAILCVEKALEKTANAPFLDGQKAVGFSYAILAIGDMYDLLGVERPTDWEPKGM